MIEPRSALVAFVVGLALLVGSFGYILGRGTARSPRPSPESSPLASPTEAPTPTPSETSTPSPFAAVATALPRVLQNATARVYAAVTSAPSTKRPTPTRTPTPMPKAIPTASPSIRFLNLPSDVRSGQSFTVEWRVDGPAGMSGENTTLTTSYQVSSSSGGSQSSAASKGQQSFSSFTIPKTFSTQLTYGGQSGTIQLRASARIGGQEISTEASVRLTE